MSLQGLADSCADNDAGRAIRRQDLLSSLHSTVQHRQERTAQQAATHQALLDRQASHSMQHKQKALSSQQEETQILVYELLHLLLL